MRASRLALAAAATTALIGLAPPGALAGDADDRLAPQALADDAGELLAIHSYPGGGTVKLIETCYATARQPAEMQKCIALDEVSDLADWYNNGRRGDPGHSAFWSDASLASRMTPERVDFAFGSQQQADAWTTGYLLSAYDRAVHSPAEFGPLHSHIFVGAPAL